MQPNGLFKSDGQYGMLETENFQRIDMMVSFTWRYVGRKTEYENEPRSTENRTVLREVNIDLNSNKSLYGTNDERISLLRKVTTI